MKEAIKSFLYLGGCMAWFVTAGATLTACGL